MQFHFLKLTYNDTYLSLVDPNSKSRFVCFAEKDVAMKCLNYSADFRARNRIKISSRTNVSFYCILAFDVIFGEDTESITMSGQEMDGIATPEDFGEWMDFSLKTK